MSKFWLFASALILIKYAEAGVEYLQVPQSQPTLRIINGNAAVAHSAPYMAALLNTVTYNSTTNTTSFCGGSLISPNYILTAAHCFNNVLAVKVILGAHQKQAKEPSRLVLNVTRSAFTPHPQYVPSTKHTPYDIGLIKLPTSVNYTQYIQRVTLPSADKADYYSTKGRIYGWGYTQIPPKASSIYLAKELMYADLDIVSKATCQAQSYTKSHEICVDVSKGTGTCVGDSGGPLIYNGEQVGIISGGKGEFCDDGTTYTIATNVNEFADWIRQNSDWTG